MDKLRRALGGNGSDSPDEESNIMAQLNDSATLSWSTRIKGFIACFVIGILLSILGSFALFLHKGLHVFAVFYTLGNVLSMLSTCFLMGPLNQVKRMFAPTRAAATIIVILAILLTLFAAIVQNNAIMALIFIIIQFLAMTWYSLSYIPYARNTVKSAFSACIEA